MTEKDKSSKIDPRTGRLLADPHMVDVSGSMLAELDGAPDDPALTFSDDDDADAGE